MAVRLATEEDLPRLVSLLSQLSMEYSREDQSFDYRNAFRRVMDDPRQTLLVLDTPEDGIVGTLVFILIPKLSNRGAMWAILEDVVVDSAARGKGYGEELVRHGVQMARDAGCYKVTLTSDKRRPDAHRFYLRAGFTATHEGFRMDL